MKIIMVFKTHFDIGFTDTSEKIIQQYVGSMLDEVIATCEGTAHMGKLKYVWTMPSWPLSVMLKKSGGKTKKIDELVMNGQLAWHALPFTSHFDFCGPEDYIRGLTYSKSLCQRYGKPMPISAKMTDVPGHGIMLPSILHGAGVKFLHLGCNEFATPPDVPDLFFWQAPDGSRVLTMYCKGGYGSSMTPPKDWKYPVWLAIMHTHDNCGPQSAEMIAELVGQAKEAYPHAEIICGTMDDFYYELEKCDLSSLPVVSKDLADTWIHGVGSYPYDVSLIKRTRIDLANAQKLFSLQEHSLEEKTVFMNKIEEAYDNIILFGEHTWGLDVKTWMSGNRAYEKNAFLAAKASDEYKYMESSWQEQSNRAVAAHKLAKEALAMTGCGKESYVFNPTGSTFSGWLYNEGVSRGSAEIFGKPAVYVDKIQPLSFVPLDEVVQSQEKYELKTVSYENGTYVENHRYKVEFSDATGIVLGIFDKKVNRYLLEAKDGRSAIGYQYDVYGPQDMTDYLRSYAYRFSDWGILDNGRQNYPEIESLTSLPKFISYEIQGSTLKLKYEGMLCEQFGDSEKITLELTLPPKGDEIFLKLVLENKHETPFVESGSLVLNQPIESPKYYFNKNGCVIDPEKDIIRCANHALYALEGFAALGDENGGFCVVNHDTCLVSIGETGVYKYRKEFEPRDSVLYINLFNNMWGTNFPQWIGGTFEYKFTLLPFQGEFNSGVTTRAVNLYDGLCLAKGCGKSLPVIIPEEMQIMALYPYESGHVLRLHDVSGTSRKIKLIGKEDISITSMDLQNIYVEAPKAKEIEFDSTPFGIYTFYLY